MYPTNSNNKYRSNGSIYHHLPLSPQHFSTPPRFEKGPNTELIVGHQIPSWINFHPTQANHPESLHPLYMNLLGVG
eukprot:765911-Hanusia_phi.AAC.5